MTLAWPTCLRSPATLSRTVARLTSAWAGGSMTPQSARSAGLRARPMLVFEVLAGADLYLSAVNGRIARVGQAQAVGGQHVLAVGAVRPLLVLVADTGPEHQLGARAGVVPVGQAAAKDAERLVGVERPFLRVAAVAGPDVDLVAVDGRAAAVVKALPVGPLCAGRPPP